MDMPKVGPSHQKLYVLAGEWQGTETMMPSPMGPGGTATGNMKARVDIDGFYVISDYTQQRDGAVTYRGHGVYGFDTTTNECTWYWIDSMGMASVPARGTWTGDTLTFESSMPGGKGRYSYRRRSYQPIAHSNRLSPREGEVVEVAARMAHARALRGSAHSQ